jgi:glutathione S-transferase
VFGDADKVRPFNPLLRVPTLVLDDGTVLIESHIILDYIDSLVPAEQAMFPRTEPARHRALRIAALAMGLGDKGAVLFYERANHDPSHVSERYTTRIRSQITGVLDALEPERAERTTRFWFGDTIGHADIAVAVALRFLREAHPGLIDFATYPALAQHSARCEALPVFAEIQQPFDTPGLPNPNR